MSDIPMFSARGTTDAERLSEVMSYLSSLSSAIDRELLSIDFSNLNSDLADRINKGITEHQDLSGFASKNYAKNNFTSFNYVNGITETLGGDISAINNIIGDWYYHFPYNDISGLLYELREKIEELDDRITALENKG
jgi:hypothetical protein